MKRRSGRRATSATTAGVRARDADGAARRSSRRRSRSGAATAASARSSTTCCATYAGRPTPVTFARPPRASGAGGARIALKREDLLHTGRAQAQQRARPGAARAADGQDARRRRDRRGPARRRDGGGRGDARHPVPRLHGRDRHGAAGAERRRACGCSGAEVVGGRRRARRRSRTRSTRRCATGPRTSRRRTTSSAPRSGPHPYPTMVREFQSVIGREARAQFRRLAGRDPRAVVACVGGGSNAIGLFSAYLATRVRALRRRGGRARRGTGRARGALRGRSRAAFSTERGRCSCRTTTGRCCRRTRSPRGSTIRRSGPSTPTSTTAAASTYAKVSDAEALDAFALLCEPEGILPALESVARGRLRVRSWRGSGRGPRGSWSTSRAAATRTSTSTCARGSGARASDAHRGGVRAGPGRGPRGLRRLPDGRRSRRRTRRSAWRERSGPGGRGRARARRAVLRSHRRRPGPPARGVAGARGGHDARERLRDRAADPRARRDLALVLFSYLNPDPAPRHRPRAAAEARDAGFDGALLTDLPPEEAALDAAAVPRGRPRHDLPRVADVAAAAHGRRPRNSRAASSTSSRAPARPARARRCPRDLAATVRRARKAAGTLPVAIGFGIATPEAAVARRVAGRRGRRRVGPRARRRKRRGRAARRRSETPARGRSPLPAGAVPNRQ